MPRADQDTSDQNLLDPIFRRSRRNPEKNDVRDIFLGRVDYIFQDADHNKSSGMHRGSLLPTGIVL